MKLRNLMWGACACILAAGCSNDDVAVDNGNVIANADGESYMAVRIVAANDGMSRATVGDPEFGDGTTTEGNVTSGVFYFYDANGNYVAKGVNNSLSVESEAPANDNVESVSDAVIILNNVAATPTEVIAILNGGDSDELDALFEGLTKTQALAVLSKSYNTGSNFIMSSSTYYDGSKTCYTTPISIDNLQPTEALAKQHPVDIYVERLAAKVQLQEKTGGATISDVTNVNINGTAGQTLKITVNGWGLSATNKSGYYIKNLESSWNATTPWSGWNAADKYRSYWAKDPNYSSSDNPVYPTDYNDYVTKNITDEEQTSVVTGNSSSLDYLTYNELTQNMTDNNVAYCLENTMDVATLSYNPANTPIVNAAAVTHILIAATMYAESDAGETKQTLYRYKGSFFDETNYKNAALTDLQAVTGDLYKRTDNDNETTYTQIGRDDITIADLGDGKVNIKLVNEEEVWYNNTAESTYTEYEGNVINQINGLSSADGFNQGRMYYCVPIEHLNNIPSGSSTAVVGSYGVVRNHWYKLTLETISGLGTAVYDPTEEIIPNYNPETYYVAAQLNILAWHMVNQSVNL